MNSAAVAKNPTGPGVTSTGSNGWSVGVGVAVAARNNVVTT
jgi:hypothetical protein